MYPQDVIKEILDKYVDDNDDDQVSNADLSRLISIGLASAVIPRPLAEWHEDIGPVLWWSFPIHEVPWIGTPLDQGSPVLVSTAERITIQFYGAWPGYHTHWTPLPPAPVKPPGEDHR